MGLADVAALVGRLVEDVRTSRGVVRGVLLYHGHNFTVYAVDHGESLSGTVFHPGGSFVSTAIEAHDKVGLTRAVLNAVARACRDWESGRR